MSGFKLFARSLWAVFWKMLLVEACAFVFLFGYLLVTDGLTHAFWSQLTELFTVVSEWFGSALAMFLLERKMRYYSKQAEESPQEAGPVAQAALEPPMQTAADSAEPQTQRGDEDAPPDPSAAPLLDEAPEAPEFEPADHETIVNPATGLAMVGGYGGHDVEGHLYDEPNVPVQMKLFTE